MTKKHICLICGDKFSKIPGRPKDIPYCSKHKSREVQNFVFYPIAKSIKK